MENREQQILSEIKAMIGSVRIQLEKLDAKMAELQQCVDPEEYDTIPIELEIDEADDLPFAEVPLSVSEPELPAGQEPEPQQPEPEPELPAEPEPQPVTISEQTPVPDVEPDDDMPGVFDLPETVHAAVQSAASVRPSVAEAMADRQTWRTDMPGTSVKDVRSAISLHDRIIFINHLFGEDPMAFQEAILKINTLSTLDEAVEYVMSAFPQWDMDSEIVYRFMMAVRRKVK